MNKTDCVILKHQTKTVKAFKRQASSEIQTVPTYLIALTIFI